MRTNLQSGWYCTSEVESEVGTHKIEAQNHDMWLISEKQKKKKNKKKDFLKFNILVVLVSTFRHLNSFFFSTFLGLQEPVGIATAPQDRSKMGKNY